MAEAAVAVLKRTYAEELAPGNGVHCDGDRSRAAAEEMNDGPAARAERRLGERAACIFESISR